MFPLKSRLWFLAAGCCDFPDETRDFKEFGLLCRVSLDIKESDSSTLLSNDATDGA